MGKPKVCFPFPHISQILLCFNFPLLLHSKTLKMSLFLCLAAEKKWMIEKVDEGFPTIWFVSFVLQEKINKTHKPELVKTEKPKSYGIFFSFPFHLHFLFLPFFSAAKQVSVGLLS